MFKIVALVYIMASGSVEGPFEFSSKQEFAVIDACTTHLSSDEFATTREKMADGIAEIYRKTHPDLSGEFSVAIKASCEKDESI